VYNIMNDFVGNILQNRFTPAATSCYQVHALNSDTHLSAALLCYLGATMVPKPRCC